MESLRRWTQTLDNLDLVQRFNKNYEFLFGYQEKLKQNRRQEKQISMF